MADVALGQIAGQQLEHPALPPRELLIPGAGVRPRGLPARTQPPGQDPRIGTGSDDGSCLGDRRLRALALAEGTQYRSLVQQRHRHLDRLAPGTQEGGTTLDQRLCLLGPAARGERYPERQRDHAAGLLGAVLPDEFRCTLGQHPLFLRDGPARPR